MLNAYEMKMRLFIFLLLILLLKQESFSIAIKKDAAITKQNEPVGDEDDDIDPFEDDMPQIKYPQKSLMPKAVMDESGPVVVSEEHGSGSGTMQISEKSKMAERIDNLEKYFILLAEKLNRQETTNKELLAAIATQQQQRMQEKSALTNAIGSLQGTILQLNGRVNDMPNGLGREEKRRKQKFLISALNRVSNRLNELGDKAKDSSAKSTSEIMTRETESTSKLLGELLGKEASKALSLVGDDGAKAKPAPQPQIGVTFPSTSTGQAPAGSPATSAQATTIAAAKPPVSAGGYNVLPLVPAPTLPVQQPAAIGPQVPLDPPSIGLSPKADPNAVTDELPVPSSVNPYEILTSAQVQPKTLQGASAGPNRSSQEIDPFGFLTTSQLPLKNFQQSKERGTKINKFGSRRETANGFVKQTKAKKLTRQDRYKKMRNYRQGSTNKGNGNYSGFEQGPVESQKGTFGMKVSRKAYKDPMYHDLVKVLKMGSLRKAERPLMTMRQQQFTGQKRSKQT